MEFLIVGLIFGIVCGFICKGMAEKRGREKWLGVLLGLLFGIWAILGYLIAGDTSEKKAKLIANAIEDKKK